MDNNEILLVQRTGTFAALIIATFITSMSTTVTANMIPNFTEYFGVSANIAQWMTSGATLISGIIIPVTAFLLKKVPNRIYFFATMSAYTLGSLFSFLAPTFPVLLVSRLIQAVGCGMMIPFGQIMLLNIYPAEKRIDQPAAEPSLTSETEETPKASQEMFQETDEGRLSGSLPFPHTKRGEGRGENHPQTKPACTNETKRNQSYPENTRSVPSI